MSHAIKIGIVGPAIIVDRIRTALHQFPNFTPVFKVSDNIYDAPDFARSLMDGVDVLLFSGYSPYSLAKNEMEFKVPAHYIPLTGNGLYRSLFRLKSKTSLDKLSIDTLFSNEIEKTYTELGQKLDEMKYFKGTTFELKDKIIEFHRQNYRNGVCYGALTGIKVVSETLSGWGIPNEWVTPTYHDIIISLERALLSTEKRKNKESQIVAGLIKVDDYSQLLVENTSETDIQRMNLDIYRMLLEYVDCLDGHMTNLGGGEYLFVTTRGIFERETRGYKSIPILKKTRTTKKVSISIGVGFGYSAKEAGIHARMALRQSIDFSGNICFIVREDRSVIGPVEMSDPMVYDLSVTNKTLLEKAEKAGMTASYMSKLMAQVKRLGKTEYTAQELASILEVTVRSTHRILIGWLDAELVDIIGEEKLTTKGRPRQIYRLTFVDDEVK